MKDNFNLIDLPDLIDVTSIEKYAGNYKLEKLKNISFVLQAKNKPPTAGYGKCRSCDCRGYISKHNGSHECKNCNHHFDRHWD